MDPTVYNRFAESFVERIAERATGQDEASVRLVKARPADHVLAGFLTPARAADDAHNSQRGGKADSNRRPDTSASMDGAGEEDDLPEDSPYEQSAIGMEWLMPRQITGTGASLRVTIKGAVYARTLPDQAELVRYARWERPLRRRNNTNDAPQRHRDQEGRMSLASAPKISVQVADAQEASPELRRTEVVAVWTRVDLPALEVMIDVDQVLTSGRVQCPLTEQLEELWRKWAQAHDQDLYPGLRRLLLREPDCTPEGYSRWRLAARPDDAALAAAAWHMVVDVRTTPAPTMPDCVRVSLRVINRTESPNAQLLDYIDPNIYAAQMRVQLPRSAHRPMEFADLPRSYRYDRAIAAVGINADVRLLQMAPTGSDGPAQARATKMDTLDPLDALCTLETESVPRKRVDRLEPREIEEAAPTFAALRDAPVPTLQRILAAMRRYDETTWAEKVAALAGSARDEAAADRRTFRTQEIEAFARGIALLESPQHLWALQAFTWMNRVMERYANGMYDRWRLFQIVFVVVQLPRLAARHFAELDQPDDDAVDILWFAAGGGKTEAFLGLIVWQLFFDRLRGKTFGTTGVVRFPLRLLAFQQLQRTARVLAQAELIRREVGLPGARFSLGYFVGDNTRPNSVDNARHKRYSSSVPDRELRSLMRCPFCGAKVELGYQRELRLVEHLCANRPTQPGEEGRCPGGPDRLPIYIVDTDVYAYLPSVIVSTVDKLAILGQNRRFANMWGRFDLVCGTHGASFLDTRRECPAAVAYAKNPHDPAAHPQTCGGKRVRYAYAQPFVDPAPALLIQDELHLLSEEMGTFDAHYETAAMEMMRSLGRPPWNKPWKIFAATATIERYAHHIAHLYLKKARQFPCPGPAAYDSFYYVNAPDQIGRIFVGVLGVGRKHTPAVTRLQSLLYQELQTARELAAADLAQACARYRLPALSADELRRLVFYYELVLSYVLTRKGSDQVAEAIRSRVSRELDELMPDHGELLIEMFNSQVDTPTMLAAMEEIELAEYTQSTPAERIRGVVATNIISHGVDVNRFNIIVFAGFTRLIAEYIQASSRVGRTFPGISFLVVTPQSERDRSIFQRFSKFHEYLDRMVDPAAINRWPPQALKRTVGGILAGYLMAVAAQRMGRRIESLQHFQQYLGGLGAEPLTEDAVLAWMAQALGANGAPYPEYRSDLERTVRNKYELLANAPVYTGQYDGLNTVLDAMRSLRDVDDPAAIRVIRTQPREMLRNLNRA